VLLKIYDISRFVGSQVSHVLFLFVVCGLKRGTFVVVVCVVDLVFVFFVAPFSLLAVFFMARAFNQDVSKWNTGAVTTMFQSKCTLSLSLSVCVCVATAPSVVVCC
jgi:surface protein